MPIPNRRSRPIAMATAIALALAAAAPSAPAQEKPPGSSGNRPGAAPRAKAGDKKKDQAKGRADASKKKEGVDTAVGKEAGPGFQDEIRKTVEQRRRRRARRARAAEATRPPGAIVPWPMPPALIIRQTPEVHGEVESLLGQLRRGG